MYCGLVYIGGWRIRPISQMLLLSYVRLVLGLLLSPTLAMLALFAVSTVLLFLLHSLLSFAFPSVAGTSPEFWELLIVMTIAFTYIFGPFLALLPIYTLFLAVIAFATSKNQGWSLHQSLYSAAFAAPPTGFCAFIYVAINSGLPFAFMMMLVFSVIVLVPVAISGGLFWLLGLWKNTLATDYVEPMPVMN